ncbi:MAG: FecR family protein [Cytophagales bacterium]|nr:FecR family protein [Cytophagales bacterium]
MNKDLTLQEILSNPAFAEWAKGADSTRVNEFNKMLEQRPELLDTALEVRQILDGLEFQSEELTTQQIQALWATIDARTNRKHRILSMPAYRWAAVFLLAAALGLLYFLTPERPVQYTTLKGETLQIELADGSSITLNQESTLEVSPTSRQRPKREIHLRGEAFFEISSLVSGKEKVPFLVHTDQAVIQVTGTAFNVNTRRKGTRVVLQEGAVQVHARGQDTITMEPGQMATVSGHHIHIQAVNPQLYASWVGGKWVFQNQSFQDISRFLSQQEGLHLTMPDSLYAKHFTATVPAGNVGLLLSLISETFDLGFTQENDSIWLHGKAHDPL